MVLDGAGSLGGGDIGAVLDGGGIAVLAGAGVAGVVGAGAVEAGGGAAGWVSSPPCCLPQAARPTVVASSRLQ
ncbi:hypothetical protein BV497_16520 [Fulvimonas soli]|nr:hypothetical protein BV497_16520 [Fulvimonas soli]